MIRALAEQKTSIMTIVTMRWLSPGTADQVVFMDGGVIVEQGDARQVIDTPGERTRQFLARYSEN